MSEINRLNLVREYWKHADEGLQDGFARMQKVFAFYEGDKWDAVDLKNYISRKGRHLQSI